MNDKRADEPSTPRQLTIAQELSLHEIFRTHFSGVDVGLDTLRNGTNIVQDSHTAFTILGDCFEKILKGLLYCTRALQGLPDPDFIKSGTKRPNPKLLVEYKDPKDYKENLGVKSGHNIVALLEHVALDICEIYNADIEELKQSSNSPLEDTVVSNAFSLLCFYWAHMRYAPLDVLAGDKDDMENEAYKFLLLQEQFSIGDMGITWKIIPVPGLDMAGAASQRELRRWADALHILKSWLAMIVEDVMKKIMDGGGLSEITTDLKLTDFGALEVSVPNTDAAGELALVALQEITALAARPFVLGHIYSTPAIPTEMLNDGGGCETTTTSSQPLL